MVIRNDPEWEEFRRLADKYAGPEAIERLTARMNARLTQIEQML